MTKMIVELNIEEAEISKQTMKDLKRLQRVWKMKSVEEVIGFLLSKGAVKILERRIELHTDAIFGPKHRPIKISVFNSLISR